MMRCPFCFSSNVEIQHVGKTKRVGTCSDCGTGWSFNVYKTATYKIPGMDSVVTEAEIHEKKSYRNRFENLLDNVFNFEEE